MTINSAIHLMRTDPEKFKVFFEQLTLPEESEVTVALEARARTRGQFELIKQLTAPDPYFIFSEFYDTDFSDPEDRAAYFERFSKLPREEQLVQIDQFYHLNPQCILTAEQANAVAQLTLRICP